MASSNLDLGTMSPNIEPVRRWYALLASLGGTGPNDDSAFVDRVFGDYLDEEYELRLPGGYPEGEPVFRGREGFAQLPRDAAGRLGRMAF